MMKKAKDIRVGNVLKLKNDIFTVLKADHFNPSEKACVMKMKMVNIQTGQVVNDTFLAADVYNDLRLDESEMQYLFNSGDLYTFMDTTNYEQVEIEKALIGDQVVFIQEEMVIKVKFYEGRPVIVELPSVIEADIDYTEDVEKGNTSGLVLKDATLPNGHVIKVPAFVKIGDRVKVDTRTGEYMSRA